MAGVHRWDLSRFGHSVCARRNPGVPPVRPCARNWLGPVCACPHLLGRHAFLRARELLEIEEAPVVKGSPYRKYSDPDLIAMCLRGDKHAWDALIRRYKRFIFAIPIKFRFAESDSSDIFQTTCVKLLE